MGSASGGCCTLKDEGIPLASMRTILERLSWPQTIDWGVASLEEIARFDLGYLLK